MLNMGMVNFYILILFEKTENGGASSPRNTNDRCSWYQNLQETWGRMALGAWAVETRGLSSRPRSTTNLLGGPVWVSVSSPVIWTALSTYSIGVLQVKWNSPREAHITDAGGQEVFKKWQWCQQGDTANPWLGYLKVFHTSPSLLPCSIKHMGKL